jgi:hypothetical protein
MAMITNKSSASISENSFCLACTTGDKRLTGLLLAVWPCTFIYLPVKCLALPPSSRGLGHQPFKLKIRGSNPLGGIFAKVFEIFSEFHLPFHPPQAPSPISGTK